MNVLADVDVVTILAVVFAAGGAWVQLRNLGRRLDRFTERIDRDLRELRAIVLDPKWRHTSH